MTRSGEVRWLRDYARSQWDEQKLKVVRVVGALQDIILISKNNATYSSEAVVEQE